MIPPVADYPHCQKLTPWRNAQDVKGGAGQYFTPRPLIRAMVEVMQPCPESSIDPSQPLTISDPACGTGGFLLAAHEYIQKHHKMDAEQRCSLATDTFHGVDIVDSVARLCAMNLYLHGIGSPEGQPPITSNDALASPPTAHYDMVLANPPFGKKGGFTIVGDDGKTSTEKHSYARDDFWATTSNKHLKDFTKCYQAKNRNKRKETDAFKKFSYDELIARDKANLDIFWLKDDSLADSENLPAPAVLAADIIESLEAALEEFRGVEDEIKVELKVTATD